MKERKELIKGGRERKKEVYERRKERVNGRR